MSLPVAFAALSLFVQDAPKSDPAVTRADLERCVGFLASDELRGRPTGSAEAMRAAEFLAQALARAGVEPAGDGGTFLQQVPFAQLRYTSVPKLTVWDDSGATRELTCGVDFDWSGGAPSKKRLRARPVTKDEEMIAFTDDEVALFLDGAASDRKKWLGAGEGAGFGLVITPGSEKPGDRPTTSPPRPARAPAGDAPLPVATIRARGELLAALRERKVKALRVECEFVREGEAANVVGILRGTGTPSEPALAAEAVVFSAHYDHLGHTVRASEPGTDTIMNGADDDASGCAAVLELAEALAARGKPARTLIFLFATGEEIGLVGTRHFIEHPAVPFASIVCNLNFEMLGRPDPLAGGAGKLWLTGDERSNLGESFRKLGLPVIVDPRPQEHFFERSDNYAFAVRGVVAQTLSSYNLHKDYHGVDDETDRIDFAHMEAAIRASLPGVLALADGSIDPTWNPGGDPSKEPRGERRSK